MHRSHARVLLELQKSIATRFIQARLAKLLSEELRDCDLIAQHGERFVVLLPEMDQEQTIEALAAAIAAAGHHVVRIGHVRQLIDKLAAGERPDLVFNICEGVAGYSREAQVPALLDAMNIAYTFSDPLVMCVCLHKGWTKSLLREAVP